MTKLGLLLDYTWCTGCHSCELSCQVKNELPDGQFGIIINEIGPWEYAPKKWQYTYIPVLTDQCNLCADRIAEGKQPSCVQHCQANCIKIVPIDEALKVMKENDKTLFMTL